MEKEPSFPSALDRLKFSSSTSELATRGAGNRTLYLRPTKAWWTIWAKVMPIAPLAIERIMAKIRSRARALSRMWPSSETKHAMKINSGRLRSWMASNSTRKLTGTALRCVLRNPKAAITPHNR